MQNQHPFRRIAAQYRDYIKAGKEGFRPGDSFPARRVMAAEHNRSRDTIDKAMELLVAEGLVVLRGNQPATVAPAVVGVPSIEDRMSSLRATGKILGKGETCEILSIETVQCPADIAAHLNLEPGTEVLRRARRTKRNGKPLAVSYSYFPAEAVEAAPELAEPENIPSGARELAAYRMGSPQEESLQVTVGQLANDEEKTLLELTSKYAMVLHTLRVVWLADGRVVEAAMKVSEASLPMVTRQSLAAA